MFERYFVRRSDYDKDMARLRSYTEQANKQLRDMERQKGEAKLEVKAKDLEVAMLHHEIKNLRKRLERKVDERSLAEYLPPMPEGETARKEYVAQVAGFFHGGLRDKLNYMHLQFRNQTGMFPLNERETDFFRSCINVVGLLLDWGEECVNEHNANIANVNRKDADNVFDDDETEKAVQNIKRTVSE